MFIQELVLETAAFNQLFEFYHLHLGFPLVNKNENQFAIKIGTSNLMFKEGVENSNPFYHFAINIPENRINEALNWLKKKNKITTERGLEIIHFESWDAHAIYFNDPAGNIVEIIARHQIPTSVIEGDFSIQEFQRIDEIGLPAVDVYETVEILKKELSLEDWKETSDTFATVGDVNGLFIVVKDKRMWYMSDNQQAIPYPIQVTILGDQDARVSFSSYTIISKNK